MMIKAPLDHSSYLGLPSGSSWKVHSNTDLRVYLVRQTTDSNHWSIYHATTTRNLLIRHVLQNELHPERT
jgi:hypothetical protein